MLTHRCLCHPPTAPETPRGDDTAALQAERRVALVLDALRAAAAAGEAATPPGDDEPAPPGIHAHPALAHTDLSLAVEALMAQVRRAPPASALHAVPPQVF